ncbi:MAG: hypothetical protein V8Q54_05520 [Alistipes senegalensis]
MVLEVAGFGITLGQAPHRGSSQKSRSHSRVEGAAVRRDRDGFGSPHGYDYAGYPAETADFLDLRAGNSFHFGVTPIGLAVRLDGQGKFEFATGLRYTVNNYRLSDNTITLGREDGLIVPVTLDERADKSKLRTASLGIPLQFSFDPVRKLRIAVVGYCDSRLGPMRSTRSRR